jgi:hypothetical protein
MLCNAEIEAVLSVLWYTHAIRLTYEDYALNEDEMKWSKNGGMFSNFSRYNSQRWKDMMGTDDPTVRGRRISSAAMSQARSDFEESYREPVIFALELVGRVRAAVAKGIEKNGPSEDGDYKEEVGMKAWQEIASEPAVREKLAKLARKWCNVDASSLKFSHGSPPVSARPPSDHPHHLKK